MSTFRCGHLYITSKARAIIHPNDVITSLAKYVRADWSDQETEGTELLNLAIERSLPVVANYQDRNGSDFVIVTDMHRRTTIVMLSHEINPGG